MMNHPRQLQHASSVYLTENLVYWRLLYRSILIFVGLYAVAYIFADLITLYIPAFDPINLATSVLALVVSSELGLRRKIYCNSRWNLMVLLSGFILAASSLMLFIS